MIQSYLANTRIFSGRYRKHLANHLPMALIAMHQLGASAEAMTQFFERESQSLEPLSAGGARIHRDNWQDWLGQPHFEPDYTAFFHSEILNIGREAAIARFLPALIPDVIGGAFHPLIQAWYAFQFGEAADLALALANWASF